MKAAEFGQFIQEKGHVAVSGWLLEKHQALNIGPEELGFLLLALFQQQQNQKGRGSQNRPADQAYPEQEEPGANPWLGRALDKGWAKWRGEGADRQIVFDPLWQKLYELWEEEEENKNRQAKPQAAGRGDFDYCRIVKELDRLRGSLSITAREKQLIQEFNIKYGWSTDFILNFFRLCSQRDLGQMKNYKPLAAQIYRSGIYTLEGLTTFMNEVDWTGRKAAEIKKDYLGLYGMVTVMERDYYVKWHIAWGLSHGLILRAARESVGAANATFKYIDSILESWHAQGINSLEACEEAIRLWKEEKKAARGQSGQSQSSQNRQSGPGGQSVQRAGRTNRRQSEKERGSSLWAGYEEEDQLPGEKPAGQDSADIGA